MLRTSLALSMADVFFEGYYSGASIVFEKKISIKGVEAAREFHYNVGVEMIAELVQEFGQVQTDANYYRGLIESLFEKKILALVDENKNTVPFDEVMARIDIAKPKASK